MERNIYNTCSENSLLQSVGPYRILTTSDFPYQSKIETVAQNVSPIIFGKKGCCGEALIATYEIQKKTL